MRIKEFKYEKVAKELETNIRNGNYKIGEKLPSIRKLNKKMNYSVITITKALEKLERIGLVEARPKSGYYVSPPDADTFQAPKQKKFQPKKTKVSIYHATGSILSLTNDPSLTSLGCSVVNSDILPYKSFTRIIKNISKSDIKKTLQYSPIQGEYELRRQIAKRSLGVIPGIKAEDIIITNGCIEAISLCLMSTVEKGETVAIESPSYPLLLQTLHGLGISVVEIPSSHESGFDINGFETVVGTIDIKACILTPNFNNPIGALMPDDNKKRIVDVCNNYNIPIIENSIYSELYYGTIAPTNIKTFDKNNIVMNCSSYSKTLAAGLRVGWVIPGKRFFDKILKLKSGLSMSSNTIGQLMVTEFLINGGYDRHLRMLRENLYQQAHNIARAIKKYFPEGTNFTMPKGGFMLWIELPSKINSMDIFQEALERKVLTIPGLICSNLSRYKNYLRVSCGSPYTKDLEEGIAIVGEIITRLLKKND